MGRRERDCRMNARTAQGGWGGGRRGKRQRQQQAAALHDKDRGELVGYGEGTERMVRQGRRRWVRLERGSTTSGPLLIRRRSWCRCRCFEALVGVGAGSLGRRAIEAADSKAQRPRRRPSIVWSFR